MGVNIGVIIAKPWRGWFALAYPPPPQNAWLISIPVGPILSEEKKN